ncbi:MULTISPECIES: 4-hydroxybenzoate octaprenyltransferase [Cycloclasticus]|jgi:4-hydroxybenzoate polyprenyltransferase|uniref:4-hydroxybenzoate octaprenyltransferase n=1 Tax=Cycloclasticus pugetii TaxID=34068 RepID=A0AB33Z0R1_9GAMM|nr:MULTISPECIES: 4-hydroxybenzoate octaprenyltransferase [Cycloclasticus]AFT67861.1 4-hydroxybenzoate octaprenyltransferase ubia protein [Cycloclasticus sp. P1]ATI02597.1 4-hydroxybenzoate octaprenyltransferase [Cycloclasticus sp. PY97N]EPD12773.1 4-hydroxybenzoate octaprenyltransferase [Cycloclasticus pugetii]
MMKLELKKENIEAYWRLTRMHKPIGSLLLLWPMYWALWIASNGKPDILVLIVFTLGVVLMRSAGCVINDYADRKLDPHVLRTKDRPLALGQVEPTEALQLFFVLVFASSLLVLLMNMLTIYLSLGAVFLASLYPFMKRHTHLPQIFLGMAFGWAVPMIFAAQTNTVPAMAWLIFTATVIWAVIYDTMYAMVDRDDDLKIGVKSTAILFGDLDKVLIGFFQLLFFIALIMIGQKADLGSLYFTAVFIAFLLSIYHQYLIKDRDRSKCMAAFLNNNWLGLIVFVGIAADYAVKGIVA